MTHSRRWGPSPSTRPTISASAQETATSTIRSARSSPGADRTSRARSFTVRARVAALSSNAPASRAEAMARTDGSPRAARSSQL